MKISTVAKLISGLFIVANQTQSQSEPRSNYNILFPDDRDLEIILKDMPQVLNNNNNLTSTNLYTTNQNITTLALTESEAKAIKNLLQSYDGIIEPDYAYNADITAESNTQILATITNCNVPIYGEDIVIMGTKIYPSQPAFQSYTMSTIYDFYNNTACHTHETKVAEVVTKVIKGGDIKFLNAVTADCTGSSRLFIVIDAINAAMRYKKSAGINRRMTINFSSTGLRNQILDLAFKNAVKAGIRVVTAAGNFAQEASNYSPAGLGCTVAESIGGTNGQVTYSRTNYGECVDLYLPACLQLRNPINGISSMSCGTSFSSPFEAARGLIRRFYYPQDTPAQTKFALKNDTISIPVPSGSSFSGTMRVITADMECPKNTNPYIFKGIVPINSWLALAPPDLCVKFTAKSNSGAIVVNFIGGNTEVCTLTIGSKQQHKNGFFHSLKCNDTILAETHTEYRAISRNDQQFNIFQKDNLLLVSFRRGDRDQNILSSASIGSRNAISFNMKGGKATLKNALHCKL